MGTTRPKLKISTGRSIVVLGAGIAGLRVAQRLQKQLPVAWHITLVDKSAVHVFAPDLYQVATVFSDEITDECFTQLHDTVATPISRLVNPWRVSFLQNEVTGIDPKKKRVFVKEGKPLEYDYLVVALGSVSNHFGIRGVKDHAYPLKTVHDALAINCHLDQLFHGHYKKGKQEMIRVSIGGGGATGVEVAGELMGTLRLLCKKYDHDPKKVEVQLIQGGKSLGGFDEDGTQLIKDRLKKLGVKLFMGGHILELKKDHVLIDAKKGKNKKILTDMLIWTAGVKVNPVVAEYLGRKELRGGVAVDDTLRALDFEGIFACGDNAPLADPREEGRYLPMMAQVAWKQADVVVVNLLKSIQGREDWKKYKISMDLYVVPVGSKFTVFQAGKTVFHGWWTKFVKKSVSLKYAMAILPIAKAIQKWRSGDKIFIRND